MMMATMNLHVFIVKIRNKKRIKKIRHCGYITIAGIEEKNPEYLFVLGKTGK